MSRSKEYFRALPALGLALLAFGLNAQDTTFRAKLTGAAHLPEPVVTKAEGDLVLSLSPDGKKLSYTVTVKDLQNAAAADLHLGPATANGPLVVKLFPRGGASAKKGSFSGTLAEGNITAADLTGPMTGASLADLVAEIRTGNTYVNIHTSDGMDPPNSGPGDYRLGEIRGQIQ
jgi:hypothetical protein